MSLHPVQASRIRWTATAIALAIVAGLAGGHAHARAMAPEAAGDEPAITVLAPRTVKPRHQAGAASITGTVSIAVRLDDLDLARPESTARLARRIDRVAQDACRQLDRLYPLDPDPDCADKAASPAHASADRLLASVAR